MTSPFNAYYIRTYTPLSDKLTYITVNQVITLTRIFRENTDIRRKKEIQPNLTASKMRKFSETRHIHTAPNEITNLVMT